MEKETGHPQQINWKEAKNQDPEAFKKFLDELEDEQALWDNTLLDGLEIQPYENLPTD